MRLIMLCILLCFSTRLFSNPEIPVLRSLYYKAAVDKDSWKQMAELLSPIDAKSPPILVCYKGVSEIMEAKYVISPWSKLNSFNSGKELIESAVNRDGENLEIRFLRFSVQTNLPSFLNYRDNIASDKAFLINNVNKSDDNELKKSIIQYLCVSRTCTEEELKRLNK